MNEDLKKRIEYMIQSKKVFLFMKGTPDAPQCGFSLKVGELLKSLNVDFGLYDVLENEDIRQGIKEYANWPTIPQLYINGKFIGGCDITQQLAGSGELKKLLEE